MHLGNLRRIRAESTHLRAKVRARQELQKRADVIAFKGAGSVKMHDGNRCVEIKELVVKGEIKTGEMVGEKDSERCKMALNETKETLRLSGRSRCAPHRQSSESHTERKGSFTEV